MKARFLFRLGPEGGMLGERRHKDELDSGDDSDHGNKDNDDVSLCLISLTL